MDDELAPVDDAPLLVTPPEPPDGSSSADATGAEVSGHVDGVRTRPRLDSSGWAIHPTVVERYFTTHTTSNHQSLHVHSNGICVLGVSPSHPMLQPPLRVKPVRSVSSRSRSGPVRSSSPRLLFRSVEGRSVPN